MRLESCRVGFQPGPALRYLATKVEINLHQAAALGYSIPPVLAILPCTTIRIYTTPTWLHLQCQHSLLHASVCVPLSGLRSHWPRNAYIGPSYPYANLNYHISIPGATYACAKEQRACCYAYICNTRYHLDRCTAPGSTQQRNMHAGPNLDFWVQHLRCAAVCCLSMLIYPDGISCVGCTHESRLAARWHRQMSHMGWDFVI